MITDDHNPTLQTKTLVEGEGIDSDGDGIVDAFRGIYKMLECDGGDGDSDCELYQDDSFYEEFTTGEWEAERINDFECDDI